MKGVCKGDDQTKIWNPGTMWEVRADKEMVEDSKDIHFLKKSGKKGVELGKETYI